MRKYLVLFWLLLPLPVVVVHFGRGQEWLALDMADDQIRLAQDAEKRKDWKLADELYQNAAKLLPRDKTDLKLRVNLAQVRVRYGMGDGPAAIDMVDNLMEDRTFADMPAAFHRETRAMAGRIHYYAAWVMRLEGASRDLWMEQADLARQNFRLLAEQDAAANVNTSTGAATATPTAVPPPGAKSEAAKRLENLESAVQLERIGLTELMARPMPKEGQAMSGQAMSEQMGKKRGDQGGDSDQRGPSPGRLDNPDRFRPINGS